MRKYCREQLDFSRAVFAHIILAIIATARLGTQERD
jgi:hypothetical protein